VFIAIAILPDSTVVVSMVVVVAAVPVVMLVSHVIETTGVVVAQLPLIREGIPKETILALNVWEILIPVWGKRERTVAIFS
jgi:hypothetical protein